MQAGQDHTVSDKCEYQLLPCVYRAATGRKHTFLLRLRHASHARLVCPPGMMIKMVDKMRQSKEDNGQLESGLHVYLAEPAERGRISSNTQTPVGHRVRHNKFCGRLLYVLCSQ